MHDPAFEQHPPGDGIAPGDNGPLAQDRPLLGGRCSVRTRHVAVDLALAYCDRSPIGAAKPGGRFGHCVQHWLHIGGRALMTLSTSLVAVWYSSDSSRSRVRACNSPSSRAPPPFPLIFHLTPSIPILPPTTSTSFIPDPTSHTPYSISIIFPIHPPLSPRTPTRHPHPFPRDASTSVPAPMSVIFQRDRRSAALSPDHRSSHRSRPERHFFPISSAPARQFAVRASFAARILHRNDRLVGEGAD